MGRERAERSTITQIPRVNGGAALLNLAIISHTCAYSPGTHPCTCIALHNRTYAIYKEIHPSMVHICISYVFGAARYETLAFVSSFPSV